MNASFYQSRFDAMAAIGAKLGVEPTQVSVWGEPPSILLLWSVHTYIIIGHLEIMHNSEIYLQF